MQRGRAVFERAVRDEGPSAYSLFERFAAGYSQRWRTGDLSGRCDEAYLERIGAICAERHQDGVTLYLWIRGELWSGLNAELDRQLLYGDGYGAPGGVALNLGPITDFVPYDALRFHDKGFYRQLPLDEVYESGFLDY